MSEYFGSSGEGLIMTANGEFFDLLNPTKDQIDIEVIAHALSKMERATGHFTCQWSVAQHSILVAELAAQKARKDGLAAIDRTMIELAGLLHDASEAYIVDLPRPLKYLPGFEKYREMEKRIQDLIYEKYGIPTDSNLIHEYVKWADNEALKYEFYIFMDGWEKMLWCHDADVEKCHPIAMGFIRADWAWNRESFLKRFYEICDSLNEMVARAATQRS